VAQGKAPIDASSASSTSAVRKVHSTILACRGDGAGDRARDRALIGVSAGERDDNGAAAA
jgi:hypothetical protein